MADLSVVKDTKNEIVKFYDPNSGKVYIYVVTTTTYY
jgi:hypothetical protein